MKVSPTSIPGCLLIDPFHAADPRGSFTKIFQHSAFSAAGLQTEWREEYFSVSRRGVLRGLHFQTPPHDHAKVVHCLAGTCLDAVVDLRLGSPAYGRHETFELDAARPRIVYIPSGLAHGFCATSDNSILLYRTSTEYEASHDCGIRWDSAGIPWPTENPILSDRDRGFAPMADFASPFRYV